MTSFLDFKRNKMKALSLTANQRNIKELFSDGEEVFVIPSYQRPYSWQMDKCHQLYMDIASGFSTNCDYFVGNLVLACSKEQKNEPEIVDGQQRLITLLMFLKVLTLLHPEVERLPRALIVESILSNDSKTRIRSDVFELNDQNQIEKILEYSLYEADKRLDDVKNNKGTIVLEKCSSLIEANFLTLYADIKEFYNNLGSIDKTKMFLNYFMEHVYLLPIELTGDTMKEANSSALMIFETLNNRGQNLEDADIFKAELYRKAKNVDEETLFVEKWIIFRERCLELGLKVDDIFRYYYHIIRAKASITTNETNLRDFFTTNELSPLIHKTYSVVMEELMKIIISIQEYQKICTRNNEVKNWDTILKMYSNAYPWYAVICYLYYENFTTDDSILKFMQALTRCCFHKGSTTLVKYDIYKLNNIIAKHQTFPKYFFENVDSTSFNYLGNLKYAYALLAHYLMNRPYNLENLIYDRLVTPNDLSVLPADWNGIDLESIKNDIGNIVVLDIPYRRIGVKSKPDYYATSKLQSVKNIFNNGFITYKQFCKRRSDIITVLTSFFTKE